MSSSSRVCLGPCGGPRGGGGFLRARYPCTHTPDRVRCAVAVATRDCKTNPFKSGMLLQGTVGAIHCFYSTVTRLVYLLPSRQVCCGGRGGEGGGRGCRRLDSLCRSVQFSIKEQLLRRNAKRFPGGLVFKAHRLVYHSTVGWRVIKKKKAPTPFVNQKGICHLLVHCDGSNYCCWRCLVQGHLAH